MGTWRSFPSPHPAVFVASKGTVGVFDARNAIISQGASLHALNTGGPFVTDPFARSPTSTKTSKERSRAMEQYRDLVAEGKLKVYASNRKRENRRKEMNMGGRSADSFRTHEKGRRKSGHTGNIDRDDNE
jgi:hypothetical protein